VKLNLKEIMEKADADFEKAWRETGSMVGGKGALARGAGAKGSTHLLVETANLLRGIYLELGFSEAVNPMIIDEADIYKQYGHEAPAILDRCYYLAALPRPDIGMGADKVKAIGELGGPTDKESLAKLGAIFHDYKKGKIDGDDLVERMADSMGIPDEIALKVMNGAFPEFRKLEPEP